MLTHTEFDTDTLQLIYETLTNEEFVFEGEIETKVIKGYNNSNE